MKGLVSFGLIAVAVLIGLRIVHLAVPMIFPDTQPGPMIAAYRFGAVEPVVVAPLGAGGKWSGDRLSERSSLARTASASDGCTSSRTVRQLRQAW